MFAISFHRKIAEIYLSVSQIFILNIMTFRVQHYRQGRTIMQIQHLTRIFPSTISNLGAVQTLHGNSHSEILRQVIFIEGASQLTRGQ